MLIEVIEARIARAIQPLEPTVRDLAASLVAGAPGTFSVDQICLIWDYVRGNFRYLSDPRGIDVEYSASDTIRRGLTGDCDDCATLTASLLESIGGTARVVVGTTARSAHAYAEIYMGKLEYLRAFAAPAIRDRYPSIRTIYCHEDTVRGCWMNMDILLGDRHPGDRPYGAWAEYAVYPGGYHEIIRGF